MKLIWRSVLISSALAMVCISIVPALSCGRRFDPRPWLEDFQHLKQGVSTIYADLEWDIEHRGLDVYTLGKRTEQTIRSARSPEQARQALQDFVRSFKDPHFRLEEITTAGISQRIGAWLERLHTEPLTARTPANEACRQMHFREEDRRFYIGFDQLPGFTRLDESTGGPFPAGVLDLPGGKRLGILRINDFGERAYLGVCREEWDQTRSRLQGSCEEDCQEEFAHHVWQRLLGHLESEIVALTSEHVDALLVDITRNGGGNDWFGPSARILTPRRLEGRPGSIIRHPHWVSQIEEMAADIEEDLRQSTPEDSSYVLLLAARRRVARILEEVKTPCDRSAVWEEPHFHLTCSLLVQGDVGVPYAAPGSFPGMKSRTVLFHSLELSYREGVYSGPLYVLVDRNTGSAAEWFAQLLQDNRAATVLGERTAGAGCGYTNGGVQVTLEHARLRVWMPDCVRWRGDGVNANEGVEPDVWVPWIDSEGSRAWARSTVETLLPMLQDVTHHQPGRRTASNEAADEALRSAPVLGLRLHRSLCIPSVTLRTRAREFSLWPMARSCAHDAKPSFTPLTPCRANLPCLCLQDVCKFCRPPRVEISQGS